MSSKIEEFRGHFGLPSQDASKEAKWRPRSSKMEPKWSPKGAKWRENGAPSEPKRIKHPLKNDIFSGVVFGIVFVRFFQWCLGKC